MPETPLISIVTPSFQQGTTIEATIRSVLEQGYPRFEHLVMDGGSTDETVTVLRRYEHLQWVSEPDRGQTHAINKGLERSRGEIWAYLNSDDVYRPGCFERVAEAFADPSCQVLVGDCDRIDLEGAVIGHDRAQLERPEWLGCFWRWGRGVLIPQPAVFVRKSLLDAVGPLDESYDMAMDLELWLRLARRAPFTLLHQTLAGFRVTPETKTSSRPADMVEESRRAALAHRELVPAAERAEFVREVERQTAGHLLTLAEERRESGLAWRALRYQPGAVFSRRMLKALLLAVLLAMPLAAWGPRGHRVVGLIAEKHLSDGARREAARLLSGETLAEVSVWADDVRAEDAWSHTGSWHYVNIPDGVPYERSRMDPKGDVITAIRRYEGVLADRSASRRERATALKFLVHFVADVHQPLHVGRAEDRGGNGIELSWYGKPSNLHRVWDSGILAQIGLSSRRLAEALDRRLGREALGWRKDSLLDWVDESAEMRPRVYDVRGGKLGERYFERNRGLAEQRLAQAGVRLAALLDRLLGER